MQHGDDARGDVEADGIAGAAGGAGIVRHQDGDAALFARRLLQADHRGDPRRHLFDPIRLGPGVEAAEGQRGVGLAFGLETDGAGKDAAVELGQHDMHGEVGRRQAALAVLPGVAARRRHEGLEDGNADAVEQRLVAGLGAAGKGRRGDDRRRRQGDGCALDEVDDGRVLQARHEDRRRGDALPVQRRGQRIDRRDVGGKQHRAIEQDRHDGRVRRHNRRQFGRLPGRRLVETDLGQRLRLGSSDVPARMAGEPSHQRPHVGRPALAEIAEQGLQFAFGQGRKRDQPLVAFAALAGQQRQRRCRARAPSALSRSQP